jgi:hypothetical protein
MSLLRNIMSGLRSLFRKEQVDRELNEELGAYLEMEATEKMKQGMSRKDALPRFGLSRALSKLRRKSFALATGNPSWRRAGEISATGCVCSAKVPPLP